MKIKLGDIAKQLNISVAAVSMAINGKKGVSDETRDQVIKLATELGYIFKEVPKEEVPEERENKKYIKLLRLRKHGLVATDTDFFAAVIDGIEEECRKNGYQLLISNFGLKDLTTEILEKEMSAEVEGQVIFATELEEEDVLFLEGCRSPFVILDSFFHHQDWNFVLMNNGNATYQAVRYLNTQGHQEIGYLKSSERIYNFERRFGGYLEAMDVNGLKVDPAHIVHLEPTLQGAQRDMEEILSELSKKKSLAKALPSAFVADNDIIALGAINALKQYGLEVPKDVSVIGIDDMPFCEMTSPKLTTIKIFKREMGREAVRLLLDVMERKSPYTQKRELNTMLLERESVRRIK
ncbi:MAG: LacI family DNA-binding transcriptional regulator [Vallitaleaceae bacterium]|nr:LacI family DNA-binding transcriptional regulator [Vallitaleaceae bacterium]